MCEKFSTIQVGDVVGMIQPKISEFNGICLNLDSNGKVVTDETELETN